MRIMFCHPGASWATADVWQGVHDALLRANVEVVEYALDGRLANATSWLDWCYEHNKHPERVTPPSFADKIYLASAGIVERGLMFGADWVIAVACGWLHPYALNMARMAGLRLALIMTESPNQDDDQVPWARLVDVLWTNERTSIPKFAVINPNVHYWRHGIDPNKHHPGPPDPDVAAHDVVFVGTAWQERIDLLSAVDWTGIDLGLYGSWELLADDAPLRQYVRAEVVANGITAALYRNAKIGVNLHRTSSHYEVGGGTHYVGAESLNPRCYELAATGCFFVTDDRAEVGEVFGSAVPTFRTAADLESLIRYYLAHDAERQARAAALPALVADHTFDRRVAEMLAVLDDYRG